MHYLRNIITTINKILPASIYCLDYLLNDVKSIAFILFLILIDIVILQVQSNLFNQSGKGG